MDIKLVLLDLDGTLLDSRKRLPEANRLAMERAAARGVAIVPASGRGYGGIPEAVRTLPFVRYMIASNGARIYDMARREIIHRAEIPLDLAWRVYDYLDTLPVIYDCYLDGEGYMDRRQWERMGEFLPDAFIAAQAMAVRRPVEDFRGLLASRGQPLQKIQMFFLERDRALRRRVFEDIPRRFPQLTATSAISNNIELNIQGATKGAALLFLCRHLGISPRNAMAFGDQSNDLSMLRAAGLGVAMGNGDPDLKAQADYVTGANDEGGVAQALEHFVLTGP